VLDPQEAATPDDLAKAVEKLKAAHFALRAQGLTRWTLQDIPPEVQEAYVLLGAALAAADYGAPADPGWWPAGLRLVQTAVHVPIGGPTSVESF
jgi:hypothetical protein